MFEEAKGWDGERKLYEVEVFVGEQPNSVLVQADCKDRGTWRVSVIMSTPETPSLAELSRQSKK